MATFACVTVPPQYPHMSPPPQQSIAVSQILVTSDSETISDLDYSSSMPPVLSTPAKENFVQDFFLVVQKNSSVEQKAQETSDEGTSTSSQASPHPSSSSPCEDMALAGSPVADPAVLQESTSENSGSSSPQLEQESPPYVDFMNDVEVWTNGVGYHPIPAYGPQPKLPNSVLFIHVLDGETLILRNRYLPGPMGTIRGPCSIRMLGEPGMTKQPLPIALGPTQNCHQFMDEMGVIRHIVLSSEGRAIKSRKPLANKPVATKGRHLLKQLGASTSSSVENIPPHLQQGTSNSVMNVPSFEPFVHQAGGVPKEANIEFQGPVELYQWNNLPDMSVPPPPIGMQMMPNQGNGLLPFPVDMSLNTMAQPIMMPPPTQNMMIPSPPPTGEELMTPSMYIDPTTQTKMYTTENWVQNHNNPIETEAEKLAVINAMCCSLKTVMVVNVTATEVEFQWYPIDLNEVRAQLLNPNLIKFEESNISYQVFLNEPSGKYSVDHHLDPELFDETSMLIPKPNISTVRHLRPNTDYTIQVRPFVPVRYSCNPGPPISFRTAPGCPDAPAAVYTTQRGLNFIDLKWNEPLRNGGAAVFKYHVYVHNKEQGRMIQFNCFEGRIDGLNENTCYKISVSATNAIGESLEYATMEAWTLNRHLPVMPDLPIAAPLSHKSIRFFWKCGDNCYYRVEMIDVAENKLKIVCDRFYGASVIVSDLLPEHEYRLKLSCHNENGKVDSPWVAAKTQCYLRNFNELTASYEPRQWTGKCQIPLRAPTPPTFSKFVMNNPEMRWKFIGQRLGNNDISYNLEGSKYATPNLWRTIYRGNLNSIIIKDEDMKYLRVATVCGTISSFFSDMVLIPRDYSRSRPDRIILNDIFSVGPGAMKVTWQEYKLNKYMSYFIQRTDLVDGPIWTSGNKAEFVLENLPSEKKITVRVRASYIRNGHAAHGEWSIPKTVNTPKGLPSSVGNLEFNRESSTFCWTCEECTPDQRYCLELIDLTNEQMILERSTTSKFCQVDSLKFGHNYEFTVTSVNAAGESTNPTILVINVPCYPPSAPRLKSMTCYSHNIVFSWYTPLANGAKITKYDFNVFSDTKNVHSASLGSIDLQVFNITASNLSPFTNYRFELSASNSMGRSEVTQVFGKTLALIPKVPQIKCEPKFNSLKLKWSCSNDDELDCEFNYKLVRLSENNKQSTVYDGPNTTANVRNLRPETRYSFKIRVTDRSTDESIWSDWIHFVTLSAPPPPIKNDPTVIQSKREAGYHQVNWDHVLKDDSKDHIYRLLVAKAGEQGAKFQTVYEGIEPSHYLDTSPYSGAIHIKVLCARRENDNDVIGQCSPVVYVPNEPVELVIEIEEISLVDKFFDAFLPFVRPEHRSTVIISCVLLILVTMIFGITLNFYTST